MNRIPKLLSKTKLMRGYRCHKALYLTIHEPALEPPIDDEKQALFDQGNAVGAFARTFFSGGVLIDNKPWDFVGAMVKTRELIEKKTPVIFEAAFSYEGCYARVDVLTYAEATQKWSIHEVKSSTKVKPEHIQDAGLQAWIIAKTGLPIESINLMHINNECRYPDLEHLFTSVDITQDIRDHYKSIAPTLHGILTAIRKPTVPDIDIGPHCESPNPCEFMAHCWQQKNIPPLSVLNLSGLYKKKWDYYKEGIINIDDQRLTELNPLQTRIIECHQKNKPYIDRAALRAAIQTWQMPYIYLDFETTNPAIPRYAGTKPYQQVPFQFSMHIQTSPNAEPTHVAYLHDNATDPRPALIPALLKACGETGSIIAYYATFEGERIKELAEAFPEHEKALLALIPRLVDPLPLIRDYLYDPAFNGSFSLKSVAPALLGAAESYEGMLVSNGGEAQRAFDKLIANTTPPTEKAVLKQAMLDYCNKDTAIMLPLIAWLSA
ncbi:MAG TPA: DUF2779 domain-containing protein [Gammaproteobacteria bacterium]|nr:DUF2779 domain-containing protein [Gammaproteobacteria bacterium]